MAFYRVGAYKEALEAVEKALELEPGNERLKSNLTFMERAAEEKR